MVDQKLDNKYICADKAKNRRRVSWEFVCVVCVCVLERTLRSSLIASLARPIVPGRSMPGTTGVGWTAASQERQLQASVAERANSFFVRLNHHSQIFKIFKKNRLIHLSTQRCPRTYYERNLFAHPR